MEIYNVRTFNIECENALIDKKFHEEMKTWREEHQALFFKISLLIKESEIMNEYESFKNNNDFVFILKFYNAFLVSDIR
jgi:hypothetical protein